MCYRKSSQKSIQNPVKHLRWIFHKKFYLTCFKGSSYASESLKYIFKIRFDNSKNINIPFTTRVTNFFRFLLLVLYRFTNISEYGKTNTIHGSEQVLYSITNAHAIRPKSLPPRLLIPNLQFKQISLTPIPQLYKG